MGDAKLLCRFFYDINGMFGYRCFLLGAEIVFFGLGAPGFEFFITCVLVILCLLLTVWPKKILGEFFS